jgi:heparan-alpha-glucosaminide N-acetyltransferase
MRRNDPPPRLLSLDAYRGAVMLLLAANGFGLAAIAKNSESPLLQWIGFQTSHPEWISQFHLVGFALWDMIQPAFMFIVGVAVPYSFAKRTTLGESRTKIILHAALRSLLLILIGVFLTSVRATETKWIFTNVLCQIGLGYPILVILAGRSYRTQSIAAALILIASWLLFVLHPVQVPQGEDAKGVLTGFFAHWSMNANAGTAFDAWFLNLFPHGEPIPQNAGGYVTLNFIPASVTMLFGLICGQLLRDERYAPNQKLRLLFFFSAFFLALAVVLSITICPVVKRIWTPSWVFFSGAYVVLLLALFYWMIDVKGMRWWTFPFVVAGMNPLALYLMGMLSKGWVIAQLKIHLPEFVFAGSIAPVVEATLAALIFWLVVWWMHRRRVYLRL